MEESFSKLKKYYAYDDIEHEITGDIRSIFNLSIDEVYYQEIKTNDGFSNNHIVYNSKGDKDNIFSIKEYLNKIRPHLRDLINDCKSQEEWRFHLGNTVIDYKTHEEWKM